MTKSSQSKKRYAAQARKKAERMQTAAPAAPVSTPQPVRAVAASTPSRMPARAAHAAPVTDVRQELKRIGILAGILIVILVVLSRVLT